MKRKIRTPYFEIGTKNYIYGDKVLDDAVLYAKDLKDRYTVLWLAFALGIKSLKL